MQAKKSVMRWRFVSGDRTWALLICSQTRFKVAKSHFRMQVKMEWYTYRSTAVEHLCSIFQAHVDGIEQVRGR
jgi:hypothetical protein